jgi:hypothetical protein
VFNPSSTGYNEKDFNRLNISVFPNPSTDLIAVQVSGVVKSHLDISLIDMLGKQVATTTINAGQTIAYFDIQTLYQGAYIVKVSSNSYSTIEKIIIKR